MAFIKLVRLAFNGTRSPITIALDKIVQVEPIIAGDVRGGHDGEAQAGARIYTQYDNFPVVEQYRDIEWTLNPSEILPEGTILHGRIAPAQQAAPLPPQAGVFEPFRDVVVPRAGLDHNLTTVEAQFNRMFLGAGQLGRAGAVNVDIPPPPVV